MSQYFASLFQRRPNDGWFRIGNYDVTTIDLICGINVLAMILYGVNAGWWEKLIFLPEPTRSGEVWRLVTWPIAAVPNFFVLISIVFFWSFGQQVEGLMGRNRFLIWVGAVTLVPAIVLTLTGGAFPGLDFLYGGRGASAFGVSTFFLAAIWVYAATYPNVRFFDVIPIWAVAAIFTALDFLRLSGSRLGGQILFLIVANFTALSAARSLGFAQAWPIPHIPVGSGAGSRSKRSKPSKLKPPKRGSSGSRVVEGPWGASTGTPLPAPPSRHPATSASDQAELDSLLDKIGATGMDSLSSTEKQRLNQLSKRLRNR